ncbi:dehypoxanthine futalosine cyclase [Campylobacter fetus]|uniref:dehypoxanthine futalosine cyclase n=1 Tax=Campylobacter fetus TaxID=196 RepID=UPI000508EBFD|nr:dehypoxanthine futalosine cyclase [Campylobacter fetus]WKW18069.1 dehypoxanthine futalosine cyclase [Campylobacter fetus subsp. fetus]AIR78721.1 dehypoxanthinylfutalosine cyclase [Campylobacter fetus subsp. fetus 04/554]EAJ5693066.1 dehypoxanthine futalosine cyclase [Campylobacter fetus]EAJ5704614.1 dehypoxanthine futalosine cyclase [Campylobacter fetus]EAJ9256220.1 dehypoxanthine futalosine cyclase [Campylobacter fetus]
MNRIDKKEALNLIKNADLNELGKLAFDKKLKLHPEKITTFIVDRNINYTNTCWVDCKFCAFYRHVNEEEAYILSFEEIDKKIEELIAIGGTQILFQGGVHPKLKIEWYENLVEHIAKKYPQIDIHGFSAVEIDYIAKISKISTLEVLKRLQAKGLYSIPGAGAEILSDRVRDIIAPKKCSTQTWLDIHKQAHDIGMKTTATMMFGTVETDEEIVEHWDKIRSLQDQTSGFRAFILWSFQSENTKLKSEYPTIKKQSPNRYLRLLAVSRLFLDNFKNIQSSWVTQGSYIGQLALKFGANDLGSTMMEENVVKAAGASFRMSQNEMIELIKDIGEFPAKRNTNYDILERF